MPFKFDKVGSKRQQESTKGDEELQEVAGGSAVAKEISADATASHLYGEKSNTWGVSRMFWPNRLVKHCCACRRALTYI